MYIIKILFKILEHYDKQEWRYRWKSEFVTMGFQSPPLS